MSLKRLQSIKSLKRNKSKYDGLVKMIINMLNAGADVNIIKQVTGFTKNELIHFKIKLL
jgi:hypothetical protein